MIRGGGVLDTNFDATPFRSLVNYGNAHFHYSVVNFKAKTIRNSGLARVGRLEGQRRQFLLTTSSRKENTLFCKSVWKSYGPFSWQFCFIQRHNWLFVVYHILQLPVSLTIHLTFTP